VSTLIEFTHRAMSGLDVLAVAALVVWAWRAFPPGHLARLGAVLSAVFLATEALIGALLVKLEHVARNASVGRAYSLSAHLVNTLILLACLTLTVWWAYGGRRPRPKHKMARWTVPAVLLFVLVGISGAIAALGDTLFPARSLVESFRLDFDPSANIFLQLRIYHPILAVAAASWLALFAALYRGWRLLILVTLQVLAGTINVFLLAPVWMQMVHLLLADLVWIALIVHCAATMQSPTLPSDLLIDAIPPRVDRLERVGPK